MSKLQALISSENFPELLQKLEDLAKISDTLKLKIDKTDILLYSIVGDQTILAFKSYILTTKDFIDFNDKLQDFTLDIIIPGAKKFVKNLNFIKTNEKIKLQIDTRTTEQEDTLIARLVQIKNGKLKVTIQCGELSEIKDISKTTLEQRLDFKNSKWSFKIPNSEFQDIKKLSSINSEGRIIHLNVESKKVILSETSIWEYQVDEVDMSDRHLMFSKTFLPSINDKNENINFYIFDTFILNKDSTSNLMISFEQDFSVDD